MNAPAEELAKLFISARVGQPEVVANVENMRKTWHLLDQYTQWTIQQGMASAGIIATAFVKWAAEKNPSISASTLGVALPHVIAAAIESMDSDTH